ncbi:hypothetical protein SERLA73DRAFT_114777 [Serpula lacrymans var. lacrymans S7.3]|uniref:Glutathione S-transferase UstS-like C-terminal domain-containing protein n=2 Tax=Serpula lacrymans var. lacrymans TaxID=341189 RepID=F8QBD8_SERL3|nr:uncharacterized protein SERLADRAFT_363800 [Serpula lacrymans var. lacrymans S7.9]EGN94524.1 hypothetical protein SERLA73DRAFT_114777 [Serpula lacrymans var. lacrymans S7.3]EGO20005.1 hypothetical protein SERLADRAFT_363800 [Serpula lacrymans var. lacrymans S7.9]
MSQPMIILYDVPSSNIPQPWAPNIWRIRLILNYKRLPYRTAWVEFPDVEKTLRSIGAPPTSVRSDGRPVYSLPAIFDPMFSQTQPVVLSNPHTIAEYLESTYPARQIFPEGSRALQTLFVHYIQDIFVKPLLPIMVPLSHQRLPERSQTHFRHGSYTPLPPPSYLSVPPEREQAWRAVQDQFNFLAGVLDKNSGTDGDGVVSMGHEVTYADFAVCSVLIWVEKVAPHDGWARIRGWNGGRWSRLRERCQGYMDAF